jgi:hypothetical protein
MGRINVKRGLFRLWLVSTLIWLAAAAYIRSPIQPVVMLWWATQPIPKECTAAVAIAEHHGKEASPLAAAVSPASDATNPALVPLVQASRTLTAAEKCPAYTVGGFERYTTGWSAVRKQTLMDWLEGIDPHEEALSSLGHFAFMAAAPSLTVLALGVALFWAIGGFRNSA